MLLDVPHFVRMMVVWIRKTMYTRYWLDKLYEVFPKFQNLGLCRWRLGTRKIVCESATTNIFAQYVASFTLYPRAIEAGHILHRISTTRVTQ
jgi:hypothetical protein